MFPTLFNELTIINNEEFLHRCFHSRLLQICCVNIRGANTWKVKVTQRRIDVQSIRSKVGFCVGWLDTHDMCSMKSEHDVDIQAELNLHRLQKQSTVDFRRALLVFYLFVCLKWKLSACAYTCMSSNRNSNIFVRSFPTILDAHEGKPLFFGLR